MIKRNLKGALDNIVLQDIYDSDFVNVTDYPVGGITNEQMRKALLEDYIGFYQVGYVFLCTDDGDYGTKTHLYKFNETSWEDVTPAGEEIDLSDYVKKTNDEQVDITTPILTVTSQGDLGATQMVLISDIGANGFQVVSSDTNDNMAGLYVSATQDSVGVKILKDGAFVDVATIDDIPGISSMVTTNTAQTISGAKNFTTKPKVNNVDIALSSDLTNLVSQTDLDEVYENINRIDSYIPSETSTTNKLADKDFVNSSVSTNTANFKGTFTSTAQLPTTDVTNNDYAFVQDTDTAGNVQYKRYKYNAGDTEWVYEYTLNNSSFTASQWATINSGVTSSTISNLNTAIGEIDEDLETIHTSLQNLSDSKQPKGDYALKSEIPDVSGFVSGTADTSATANTLVKRDANGHINANYVQGTWGKFTASATSEQPTYTGIAVYNSSGWLYKRSLDNLKTDLAIPDVSGFATTAQLTAVSSNVTAVDTKVNNLFINLSGTSTLLGYRSGTGTISLSQAITVFKWIVLVNAQNDDSSGYWKSPTYLPVSFITKVGYGREYAFHNVDNSSYRIKFNNESQAQITAEYYARRIMVYGVN